ncbi:MAG TPA: hypothetical protein VFJ57_14090 [Solirubrobacterales bacterium]|nr:hypothetical protein [Solirubrobacterales bacterium]
MPTAEVIVLAASKKMGGLCVAGVSTRSGRWARPVSDLEHGQLERGHCEVAGRLPRLLDVVRFEYVEQLDDPAQPENLLLDDRPWEWVETIEPSLAYERLRGSLVRGPRLLGNRGKAMLDEKAREGVESSLALVEPQEPLVFRAERKDGGRLSPRVEFQLRGQGYDIGITDFVVGPRLRQLGEGEYSAEELGLGRPGHVLLTASLGEPLDEWRWKLAAAIQFLP